MAPSSAPASALRPLLLALGLALGALGAAARAAEAPPAAPSAASAPTPAKAAALRGNQLPPLEAPLVDRVVDTAAGLPGTVSGAVGGALSSVYDSTLGRLYSVPGGDSVPYSLRDPHYGDTLYHFFQDRYFSAVTSLMVSQHFERVAHHADEAEVLRGGMLLSYGMPKQAGEIFANLIERGATPPVRDRAWFYLAKIRYQRGYLDEAEAALAKIEGRLPSDLQEERGLLLANLLMARADYAGAAAALAAMPAKTLSARYARYNLGVALVKSGDPAKGSAVLDALGKESAPDEEYRSLRDQTNVALGYAALGEHRPKEARAVLERVRLRSLHANKALLGFGWAAAELKEPKLALVPWLELAARDVSDSAALEARIAVPYAYAELGAYAQALDRYQDAVGAFEQENSDLKESIAAIRSGKLVEALLVHNPGDEMGWFWSLQDVPEMPHSAHLVPVLAQHEFQEAFKNYRDLLFLGRNLVEWRDKLGVFDDMLANRQKAFAERLPVVRARASAINLEAMRQRRDGLAGEIDKGEAAADGVAFADAREVELLALIENVREGLARLEAAADKDADARAEAPRARERLRLANGALVWRLSQLQHDRAWTAKKELQTIDAELAQAGRRDAELAAAQRDEPLRFERFAARIAALRPQLGVMIPQVAALAREQQEAVQGIAVAALVRQQERLAVYSTQARFAIAQLYDRAYGRQESGHAAARP